MKQQINIALQVYFSEKHTVDRRANTDYSVPAGKLKAGIPTTAIHR